MSIVHTDWCGCASCVVKMKGRIAELLKMQEALIEWIREDCPYSREDILEIAEREMKEQGE